MPHAREWTFEEEGTGDFLHTSDPQEVAGIEAEELRRIMNDEPRKWVLLSVERAPTWND